MSHHRLLVEHLCCPTPLHPPTPDASVRQWGRGRARPNSLSHWATDFHRQGRVPTSSFLQSPQASFPLCRLPSGALGKSGGCRGLDSFLPLRTPFYLFSPENSTNPVGYERLFPGLVTDALLSPFEDSHFVFCVFPHEQEAWGVRSSGGSCQVRLFLR